MTTTTRACKLDRYKLETTVHADHSITHTTFKTDLAAQERKIVIQTKWIDKRLLGSGGFGIVILQEAEGGKLRAVKKMPQGLGKTDYSRELNVLSKVAERQDLFVHLFGWYENQDFLFIAMEYIEYGDLSQFLKTPGSRSSAREITRQLLEGLATLHDKKICHRDLKPQNILIACPHPMWVKIADFGVSKHEKSTGFHTRTGTQGYSAPEVLGLLKSSMRVYTFAVDIWALGCVVHEILTAETPFIECITGLETIISGLEPTVLSCNSGFTAIQYSPQTDMDALKKFRDGKTEFPMDSLLRCNASNTGIEFLRSLMIPDPRSRPSAKDVLRSSWLLETDDIMNAVGLSQGPLPQAREEIEVAGGAHIAPLANPCDMFSTACEDSCVRPSTPKSLRSPDAWPAHTPMPLRETQQPTVAPTPRPGVKYTVRSYDSNGTPVSATPPLPTLIPPNLKRLCDLLPKNQAPMVPSTTVLDRVKDLVKSISGDFGLIEEIYRNNDRFERTQRSVVNAKRLGRVDEHLKHTSALPGHGQLSEEIKLIYEEFDAQERQNKVEEEKRGYDIYCTMVFEKVYARLQGGITTLTDESLRIVDVEMPIVAIGKQVMEIRGGVDKLDLLNGLFELRKHIEVRYKKVQKAVILKDRRYKRMIFKTVNGSQELQQIIGSVASFGQSEDKAIRQASLAKLKRTEKLVATILQSIKRSHAAELDYFGAISDAVEVLINSPCERAMLQPEMLRAYFTLKMLKQISPKYSTALLCVRRWLNESISGVTGAEERLREESRSTIESIIKQAENSNHSAESSIKVLVTTREILLKRIGDSIMSIESGLDGMSIKDHGRDWAHRIAEAEVDEEARGLQRHN